MPQSWRSMLFQEAVAADACRAVVPRKLAKENPNPVTLRNDANELGRVFSLSSLGLPGRRGPGVRRLVVRSASVLGRSNGAKTKRLDLLVPGSTLNNFLQASLLTNTF